MAGANLATARLRLRPGVASDAAWLHVLWNDPDVGRYLWDGQAVSVHDVEREIAGSAARFQRAGYGLWVGEAFGGERIGFGALRPIVPALRWPGVGDAPELIIGVCPDRWRRGYATEMAAAIVAHGLGALGLPEIHAGADVRNPASLRRIEALGMTWRRELEVGGDRIRYASIRRGAVVVAGGEGGR